MVIRIADIQALDDCDEITADDIEGCRKELGFTPADFAEHLGWSTRKYQRAVEAAREDGAAPRDVVLSLFGLAKLVDIAKPRGRHLDSSAPPKAANGKSFFRGIDHTAVLDAVCAKQREQGHKWTADVAPHVLREVAACASQGARITYNDLAEKLEAKGSTHRVWPRTAYGRPLGSVCTTITELGRITGKRIPLLSAIVVTQGGAPGEGFDGMTKEFFKLHEPSRYRELMARMRSEREVMVAELQREVFEFPHWEEALRTLGLER